MVDQPTLVDRLLAHFQTSWPNEFEICFLRAQMEMAAEKISALQAEAGEEPSYEQLKLPV